MTQPVTCERTGCQSLADHRIGDRWLCGSHFNASVTRYGYDSKYAYTWENDPMTVTVRDSLITTISLIRFRTLPQEALIRIEMSHFPDLTKQQIEHEIDLLVADLTLVRNDGNLFMPLRAEESEPEANLRQMDQMAGMPTHATGSENDRVEFGTELHIAMEHDAHMERYRAAVEKYQQTKHPTRWQRVKGWLDVLWSRCRGGLVLLIATSFFAMGLCASEGRWLICEVTAYCGGPCDRCETTGVTANGTNTNRRPYGVAASPNIPLGSLAYIPRGSGYLDETLPEQRGFSVDDRGGALRTEWRRSGITRLDLRFRTHASAVKFGRKLICVFVTTN